MDVSKYGENIKTSVEELRKLISIENVVRETY